MSTTFHRQVQFTRILRAGGRAREFNFLKMNNVAKPSFHVDVADERGERYIFYLYQENEGWKLSGETVPKWVTEAAEQICREAAKPEQ